MLGVNLKLLSIKEEGNCSWSQPLYVAAVKECLPLSSKGSHGWSRQQRLRWPVFGGPHLLLRVRSPFLNSKYKIPRSGSQFQPIPWSQSGKQSTLFSASPRAKPLLRKSLKWCMAPATVESITMYVRSHREAVHEATGEAHEARVHV